MKKIISIILCAAMLCTMFAGLSVFAAETTAPAKSLVGKQAGNFNNTDWTSTAINDEKGLKAPKGTGTASATTNATYTLGEKFELSFNFVWGGYNNYYGNVVVTIGTNKITVGNMDSQTTNGNYKIVVETSAGTVATAELGADKANIGGKYVFTYADGKLSATRGGNVINWTVGDSTATSVAITFDKAVAVPVKASVGGNYADNRYLNDFALNGTVNGDVNYDGAVDTADLLESKQAMLGVDGAVDVANCDNNYDDAFTTADILSMTHHILGTGLMANYERDPVKIMAIGDSITAGAGVPAAWRYFFFEKLYSYGANFRLVGHYTSVEEPRLPEGYRGHSAVGGHKTSDVIASLDNYMAVDFDVIAMMIGTNDADKNLEQSIANYRTILNRIYETNPNAKVYIASLCPKDGISISTWWNFGINPNIPQFVDEYKAKGYDITYVDNITGYDWSSADFIAGDPVHPNAQGREKVADAYFNAMKDDVIALGNKMPTNFTYNPAVGVTDLEVAETFTVEVGAADTVEATVLPSNAVVKSVLWSTDDASIATVSNFGRITGVSEGTTTVTATTLDGGIAKKITVNVVASTQPTSTQRFLDTFENINNWSVTASSSIFSINNSRLAVKMSNGTETITSTKSYAFDNGFELSYDYSASTNETPYGNGFYVSVKYAGIEVRTADCGRYVILLDSEGNTLGSYSTVMTTEYVNTRVVYKDNTITVYYDNEAVIVVNDVTIDTTSSNITIHHTEKWRNCYLDNLYLGTY